MIAVDTSALMAIVASEPEGEACKAALEVADEVVLSAATVTEALIVAGQRGIREQMTELLQRFDFTIAPVTSVTAHRVAEVYGRWGRGVNPAALNFGDCFAYEVAQENECALLYVGNDFAKTDVQSVL